jgi:hypothetical protein
VSAVILAVIVVMWAVVLVPMWLRRHDAATESRSVDRFSAAMRVLSRRQPASGTARYVLMPRRESAASVHVSGAAAPRRVEPRRAEPSRVETSRVEAAPRGPRRKPSLAVRRRRVLLTLVGLGFLTMLLSAAGAFPWILQIVIDLLAVAFVVHLRTQARRSAALARKRRRPAPVAAEAVEPVEVAATPLTPTAARYAERLARSAVPAPVADVPVAAEIAAETEELPVVAEAAATGTDDAAAWEPVPVPRPTYTMKPAAPPRHYPPLLPDSDDVPAYGPVVGDETFAVRVDAPTEALGEPTAESGDDGQLDEILTHRWAVND